MQKQNKIVGDWVAVTPLYFKVVLRRLPLPIFTTVPEGCNLHLCDDDNSWPLLCCGDLAVIDPNQKYPANNDLLLHVTSFGKKISLVKPWTIGSGTDNNDYYTISNAANATDFEDLETWSAQPNFYRRPRRMQSSADGPCGPEWFARRSLGLVVGVFASSEGEKR